VVCKLISDDPDELNAGAAAAWVDTVEVFGSGKLSVAEVLEPAIRLATEGYSRPECLYHRRRASASLISLNTGCQYRKSTVLWFESILLDSPDGRY
jgi:hypothetical protein